MKRRHTFILLLWIGVLLGGVLAACGGGKAVDESPKITPPAGKGALTGQVQGASALWPDETVVVFAAPYYGNDRGDGVYVLEPSLHPSASIDAGGYFAINAMAPGRYVLIIGPSVENARRVMQDEKRARLYTITADQVTDAGVIELK